jgi:hypothetical protein
MGDHMTEDLRDESVAKKGIWELQREYLACPKVFGVWVRCAGEETLEDLYDSREPRGEIVTPHVFEDVPHPSAYPESLDD